MSVNFSDTVPAAPSGKTNVKWQNNGSGSVSAYSDATAAVLAPINTTGLVADVSIATLLAITAAGLYRVSGYVVETTADGASSTLPKLTITWQDVDSAATISKDITATQTGNTVGTFDQGDARCNVTAATDIQYTLSGYASGTPATMTYAVHITIEKLF